MGEVSFSKGKWWVSDGKVVMCETGKVAYAYSGHGVPYIQDVKANANLIASAPEMYEMLNRFLPYVTYDDNDEEVFHGGDFEWNDTDDPMIDELKALLAKARGEA